MEIIMNKLIGLFTAVVCLFATSGYASKAADYGTKMGEGFSRGFENSFQRGFEDGMRRNEIEANNALLSELLQGYTPARHSEYVLRIMQSNLPTDVKQQTIQQLDSLVRRAG
jgi:hypothetical protein